MQSGRSWPLLLSPPTAVQTLRGQNQETTPVLSTACVCVQCTCVRVTEAVISRY